MSFYSSFTRKTLQYSAHLVRLCTRSAQLHQSPIRSRTRETSTITTEQKDSSIQTCSPDAFYNYTSGRWLWNEQHQLSKRHVKFNWRELARVAAEVTGSKACTEIQKLPEGNFNKVFLITMDDGTEVIAKLLNPNAGPPYLTTASEVATMDYVRTVLQIPAPKVYTWSSSTDNPVGAEYIIMERARGIELGNIWNDLRGPEKFEIVKQLVSYERALSSAQFPMYGSLYYDSDLQGVTTDQLIQHDTPDWGDGPSFAVGPTTNRTFFDDGRDAVDVNRGPWSSLGDYMLSRAQRELACLQKFSKFPHQQGLFHGPHQYQPTAKHKEDVLNNYIKVIPYLSPREKGISKPVLWHPDLHADNIFVNPAQPTQILNIIDWQAVNLSPLFLQARYPGLIEFEGPIPEGLQSIQLPDNFDNLSPEEQLEAKKLRAAQSLYKLYEIQLIRQCPEVAEALRYRDSLPGQIMGLAGSLFSDGEPIVQGMLMRLEREWSMYTPSSEPCPLSFNEEEREKQRKDELKWSRGVELLDQFLAQVGAYRGWDGWVNHANYEGLKQQLDQSTEEFWRGHSNTEEEKSQWMKTWPFRNQ